MKNRQFFSIFILLLLVISCKKQNPEQLPVDVTWDRDACLECGMVISDHSYAAQVVNREGKGFLFDDIGCAVNWLKDKPWKEQARIWISDAKTQRWIDAKKAHWHFGDPNTPMGYGFVATLDEVDHPLDFKRVRHQIETDQTLKHQHQKQHVGEGHNMPKEKMDTPQMSMWKQDSQTMPHSEHHGKN